MHVFLVYIVHLLLDLYSGTEAKNATIGPWKELNPRPCDSGALMRSNQLITSYTGQLSSSNHKFMYDILGYCHV
jgi:hypothetical protein